MTAVETLEREFAETLGVPGAVATGYGRGALLLALEAVGVGGADVAVPNFICSQVPEAVRRAGGRAVFYPVRLNTTIHPDDFRDALTPRTRAAIVAHYFGEPHRNIAVLAEICRRRSIVLIEDCALALGSSAGTTGDLATFSFTKSDWCYGGGIVTTAVRDWLPRLRALRAERFCPAERLARLYGRLRRADFAANRPSRARVAEVAGREMQRLFARREPALRDANFYDAAPFDSLMPEFAARRAIVILSRLRAATARRITICDAITDRVAASAGAPPLLVPHTFGIDAETSTANHAFLGLTVRREAEKKLDHIIARAARKGVTLRRCWPAYQDLEPGQASDDLGWLAGHLLVLEIHPQLSGREVATIAEVLNG